MNTFNKVDNKIVKTSIVETTVERHYALRDLIAQKKDIIEQKRAYIAARDAELNEIQELIDQCKLLKITEEIEPMDILKTNIFNP